MTLEVVKMGELVAMRDVLQRTFDNIPERNRTQGSKSSSSKILVPEAIAMGFRLREPVPEPRVCEFCHAELHCKGIVHPFEPDRIIAWEEPDRCQCEKAKRYWEEYDKEQERKALEMAEAAKRAEMQAKIDKLLGKSGIKKRFMTRTFASFEVNEVNKEAYEIAKMYAERFGSYLAKGEGLYLVGGYGTGKTHLAAAIALHLISKGIPVVFKTLIDLLAEIRKTFDDDSDASEFDMLELYRTVDLLIIDDLGKESPTEWSLSMLYAIVNERYEACLPMIITTNYSDADLIRRLSVRGDRTTAEAIVSRLHEVCYSVEMYWDDWRQRV